MTTFASTRIRRPAKPKERRFKPVPLQTRPSVSVIIPCYNYGHFLPTAVRSALDQPGVDVEVVIAENGSTDDSIQIADRLAAVDSRIRVISQPTNINFLVNFNVGLLEATGTYWTLLSADDALPRGSLARATALMERHPEVSMVYGFCPTFDKVAPEPRTTVDSWSIWEGADWIAKLYRAGRNPVRTPEVVMRTSIGRQLGGFDPDHPIAADMLLWMRAATRGHVGRINGADQGFYRIHGANMHQNFSEDWLTDLRGLHMVYETPLDVDPSARVGIDELRSQASRTIATRALRYAAAAFDSGDYYSGVAYATFASEVWPPIVRTRRWRGVAARQSAGLPGWRIGMANNWRAIRRFVGERLSRQLWR